MSGRAYCRRKSKPWKTSNISSMNFIFSYSDWTNLLSRTEGKPLKPPNSGYSLFSQKLLASDSLKNVESKNRMFEISRQWKELDDEIKNKYKLEALEVKLVKIILSTYLFYQFCLSSTNSADKRVQNEVRLLSRIARAAAARSRTGQNQRQNCQT